MFNVRFFSLLIAISSLTAPLQLSALAEEIITNMSPLKAQSITHNEDTSYVDFGTELSNIAEIISQLSDLDEKNDSILHELHKHIKNGSSFAEYDAVIATLEYAENILQKNYTHLDTTYAEKITADLNEIIDNVINGSLIRRPTLVIVDNIDVLGKATIAQHIKTQQGISIAGKLKVGKSAKFKNNVTIKGVLSAVDAVVENLIVSDCMNNLCVNNLSATDIVVDNISINGTLSITDAVIENLVVQDCMNNLCVNNLSVTNAVITDLFVGGHSLSANDAVITNVTATNLSSTDAIIINLSVADLTIAGCIDSLCVDSLSANDATIDNLSIGNLSISGTVSVVDAVVENLTTTDFSSTDAVITNLIVASLEPAGLVHNDASGILSSALLVNTDITVGTIANDKLATISSAGTPGSIVVLDGLGDFWAHEITITGTVVNPTDAATKAYVDASVTALIAKTPAVVVSVANETLSGFPTIDGVTFPSGTNRVLLTGQTNLVENGLWIVAAGAWSRPADFASGATAGEAYVLILEGTVNAGSSWLCNTPSAVIDTDPIGFALFTLAETTTGANVGTGQGLIFRDKTANFINFKTLLEGDAYTIITNDVNDVSLSTNATSANTATTIVARDNTGSFAAQTISIVDAVMSGTIQLSNSMSATIGNITKNGLAFISNYGTNNTFIGVNAGNFTTSGTGQNSAFGTNALVSITTGTNNIAIGYQAAQGLTTGNNNIYLNASAGSSSESNTTRIGTAQSECFIAGIAGVGISGNVVTIDSNGQLGIALSSRRFKHNIQDMGDISENIFKLRPVTFIYNNDDTEDIIFGLIAEEVEELLPEIVSKDADGLPYTVRYNLLPVLLLNELQKQQKIIETQQTTIVEMNNAINQIRAELQEYCDRTIA